MSREFKSIKELNEYLSSIKDGVNHRLIPQVLSLAGNTLKNIIETSFVEQKSPSGVSFAPLKKNTKAYFCKRFCAKYFKNKIDISK